MVLNLLSPHLDMLLRSSKGHYVDRTKAVGVIPHGMLVPPFIDHIDGHN